MALHVRHGTDNVHNKNVPLPPESSGQASNTSTGNSTVGEQPHVIKYLAFACVWIIILTCLMLQHAIMMSLHVPEGEMEREETEETTEKSEEEIHNPSPVERQDACI